MSLFHNELIKHFKEIVLEGVLTPENLVSKKKAVKVNIEGNDTKCYGYFLHKGNETWFLLTEGVEDLPIKVTKQTEQDFRGDVFYLIEDYDSVKIPNKEEISFRELVDLISGFKHTNPIHFLLYKIITIAAYCNRINYRVIAPAGFGKDCVINNLIDLGSQAVNIYGATYAKLEYSLKHPFLLFNEMGNLKKEGKADMQQFLLATGCFMNSYTKKSRATSDGLTLETYDISKTSLGIVYNPPCYYIERGQEYFDIMFQPAVINRFIPFNLTGVLEVPMTLNIDTYTEAKKSMTIYKKIVSTINYYKGRDIENIYETKFKFNKYEERYKRTFETICKYICEYSKDEEEYKQLTNELYKCFINYKEEIRKTIGEIKYEEV